MQTQRPSSQYTCLECGAKGFLPNCIFRFAAGLFHTIQIKPFAAVVHAAKADHYQKSRQKSVSPRLHDTDLRLPVKHISIEH